MYFEELKIGMNAILPDVIMHKDDMISFAKKYDNIPLHTDEECAKTTRFSKLIASGMMTYLEIWAKYIETDFFGDELIAGKSNYIEWLKPVFSDDVLTGTVTLTKLTEKNEKSGIATITVNAVNQHGDCVIRTETEALIKRKPVDSASLR